MLTVTLENVGDGVILYCSGRIVRGEETAILCSAVQHHGKNVILDLSRVEGIDAAGVGALIALRAAGIYLTLRNPSHRVAEVLRVTQLDSVLEIEAAESNPPDGLHAIPAEALVGPNL
ncbi:MAG TPA: STAS domain-containing protein [Terriglobales bacterium]|nr:STAS domain-containing protein [Terriglobales bacterium]